MSGGIGGGGRGRQLTEGWYKGFGYNQTSRINASLLSLEDQGFNN